MTYQYDNSVYIIMKLNISLKDCKIIISSKTHVQLQNHDTKRTNLKVHRYMYSYTSLALQCSAGQLSTGKSK